ncbi:MAG: hypothetical protein ACREBU_20280 [Nitrososphaera sp.]
MRRIEPRESEVQGGVIRLLRMMPEIAWCYKAPVGSWVIVRPDPKSPVGPWQQLKAAVKLGIINKSQLGFVQGAPEGALDICMQMAGSGKHAEIEVKAPGKKPTEEQMKRMALIQDNGGYAGSVDDVAKAQEMVREWSRS